jgi:hypothetical protein
VKTIVLIAGDRGFESPSLQRRVCCEPGSLDQVPLAAFAIALLASFAHSGARTRQCRGARPGSDDGHPLPQGHDRRRQYFLSRSRARRGRRINNSEPGWEATLEGRPKMAYEFWHDHLRPLGFGLKAEVLEYPGGMPGDIGFLLTWK